MSSARLTYVPWRRHTSPEIKSFGLQLQHPAEGVGSRHNAKSALNMGWTETVEKDQVEFRTGEKEEEEN
jgi:hypothetical protein